jgi:murein DD-endopeptidase MepM/ murein hydrolase activator NlpD
MFGLSLAIAIPPPRNVETAKAPVVENIHWSPRRHGDTLARRSAFSRVLASRGYDTRTVTEITHLLLSYRNPRALPPGLSLQFSAPADSADSTTTPDRIRLALTPDSLLDFVRGDSTWSAHVALVPFVMDTVRVSGVIESSLWSARLSGDTNRLAPGEFEDLVYDLADVFAWKVDFTRDLRRGDSVRLALERKVRPDGSIRSRHFLAIEVRNGDRVVRAIPQARPDGGWAYFDDEGRSLRGAFLRYPVPYRITSHFNMHRYHPILKRVRPHEGIDYGAPAGAPVEATASGVVTWAGWRGGYGNLIELRHPGNIRTRYAHLSAISAGVRVGAHIDQGQMIGRVGMTGLATGPHLHYEFLQNGVHKDPLTVKMPGAPSVVASHLADFYQARDQALALLDGTATSKGTQVANAGGSVVHVPGPRHLAAPRPTAPPN